MSGKKSHGIVRLLIGESSMLSQKPTDSPELVQKTKLSSLIVSNKNPAMLLGSLATEEVIRLATQNGFGIVGTNGTYSTSGCLSYYLGKIALADLIGFVFARSPLCLAPFNSVEPLFGTNPIGFAIPGKTSPTIFDMGTSAISWGAMLKAEATNESLPEGVDIDSQGMSTTNPTQAMNGAVLGFDGSYKSSGLAMMVEVLAGALVGAGFMDVKEENDWGNLFFAFKPDLLTDTITFKNNMDKFINRLKAARTKDENQVRIAGETTLANRNKVLAKGKVEVADELLKKLDEYLASN